MLHTGNSAKIRAGRRVAPIISLIYRSIRFLATAEDVVGPYKFGVYDLLVLPPSFPYGGMVRLGLVGSTLLLLDSLQENACLTFLTPSMRFCQRFPSQH